MIQRSWMHCWQRCRLNCAEWHVHVWSSSALLASCRACAQQCCRSACRFGVIEGLEVGELLGRGGALQGFCWPAACECFGAHPARSLCRWAAGSSSLSLCSLSHLCSLRACVQGALERRHRGGQGGWPTSQAIQLIAALLRHCLLSPAALQACGALQLASHLVIAVWDEQC